MCVKQAYQAVGIQVKDTANIFVQNFVHMAISGHKQNAVSGH